MRKYLLLLSILAALTLAACGNENEAESADAESTTEVTIDASGKSEIEVGLDDEDDADDADDDDEAEVTSLEDGVYEAEFTTDSSMFHVNDVCDGKATLTVENGVMTIHLILTSQNIVNLYLGEAEDAQKDGAELINPTAEEVTYSDGTTETVNAFDVTVPVIGEDFDLALLGTKGVWYDHEVVVSNPVPVEE